VAGSMGSSSPLEVGCCKPKLARNAASRRLRTVSSVTWSARRLAKQLPELDAEREIRLGTARLTFAARVVHRVDVAHRPLMTKRGTGDELPKYSTYASDPAFAPLQLAQLPLTGQKPQRIVNGRPEALAQIVSCGDAARGADRLVTSGHVRNP